ncbi:Na+/H+ antiporter NhaC [Halorubrum aidingense JCM 13560]|uniref:Na+/H+ antiporter NhaC n=1 Tax=Halorubrum aidingense JCM 13560 TaxID=1230454 RepID=M0PI16_9EURY|nr:Na+/H+ antiporter NhaC family protein [Halorubrum aidingense]EMA69692.1 Na+/H+ antiporter NhaC [Halorubrum aidingense JCM 13560]
MTDPSDGDPTRQTGEESPGDEPPDAKRPGADPTGGGSPGDDGPATPVEGPALPDGGSQTAADDFDDGSGDDSDPKINFYGGKWASTIPIAFFIFWAIIQSGVLGIGDTNGLVVGALIGTILGMFFVRGDWKAYADTIFEGMTQRVAATAIVAWLWAGMFAETLQVGGFVEGLIYAADALNVGAATFPAAAFVLCGLLATGIGTGYGATVAFVTLFFPAGVLIGANPVLLFAAILSGAVFGDNLAPVSDTTIVSAVTQDADIGGVVASRFKYAIMAAVPAFAAYLIMGSVLSGASLEGSAALRESATAIGLVHLISMGVVIATAVAGRHIVEAISWGLIVAVVFNLGFGLSSVADVLVFTTTEATPAAALPFVQVGETAGVGGSLYSGAIGFFPLIVLTLLIVSMAQIMIRGGGFEAIQDFLLESVATNVRRAELTMVLGTATINGMITINTAAEIAIAPYIARIGEKFNINGYRRANILDANTSALGYIFPWAGGVLVGYQVMVGPDGLGAEYGPEMVVNPIDVVPYVFHGWFLVIVFLIAAITGFGREYIPDRTSEEVSRA